MAGDVFDVSAIGALSSTYGEASKRVGQAIGTADFCTADGGTGEGGGLAPSHELALFLQLCRSSLQVVAADCTELQKMCDELSSALSKLDDSAF